MSLLPSSTPEITIPSPDDAADMMHLRARLYRQELIVSGVSEEAAARHTQDWASPDSIKDYRDIVEDWVTDPIVFLRTVRLNTDEGPRLKGIFLGSLPTPKNPFHFVRIIQLDESIRRQGVGRRLFGEMAATNPAARMELNVIERNEPAKKFYSALGFTALADVQEAAIAGGERVVMQRMRLPPHTL